jgi:predicted nucleic acid-binding protein
VVEPHSLAAFLKRHRSIYLDTSAFIYFVERHPRYFPVCEELFRAIEAGRTKASTSTLTLLDILMQPYRQKKDDLVLKFYALLTTYPHLTWVPMDLNVADQAAKLRAEHGLKTPDAIQAARRSPVAPPALCAMTGPSGRSQHLKALSLTIFSKLRSPDALPFPGLTSPAPWRTMSPHGKLPQRVHYKGPVRDVCPARPRLPVRGA